MRKTVVHHLDEFEETRQKMRRWNLPMGVLVDRGSNPLLFGVDSSLLMGREQGRFSSFQIEIRDRENSQQPC